MFGYDGKRVVVVGGATGMGAAAAKLAADQGADTIVLDVAEVDYDCTQAIQVDLRDRASVDAAIAAIDAPVHAVFACAGVADGTPGLMEINFIAQRHFVESLIANGTLGRGGSLTFISSVAGMGWMVDLDTVKDFLSTADWDEAAAWMDEHPELAQYGFSKEAINGYVSQQALPLLQQGIRINAILPGPTDTPLAQANADMWLTFGSEYRTAADVPTLQPEQMASALVFLGSQAASGVNGTTLLVDQGHVNASMVGAWDDPMVRMIVEKDFSAFEGLDGG